MLEELEKEQYMSKLECSVGYRDFLLEGLQKLDEAIYEKTTDDFVEKPDKIALSLKESKGAATINANREGNRILWQGLRKRKRSSGSTRPTFNGRTKSPRPPVR